MRLAVVASHPVQYYAPIFRALAEQIDLTVFYTQEATPQQQAAAGFGKAFSWDVDLMSGYHSVFLKNVASVPNPSRFSGADTPEILHHLREGRFKAVLVMGWYLKAHVQAIMAAKRLGLPIILRGDNQLGMPGGALKYFARQLALPGFLRRFDAVCVVGQKNRQYYEAYRYPADRMFCSPHAVETERFAANATTEARNALRSEIGVTADEELVLFAGKLVDFKRPQDVVSMVARLRSEGRPAVLLVAGSGPLEGAIRADAERLSVPLHTLGFRNQTEMPAAYAAADVLILPSTARETWGLVANEAIACGTPIVVSEAVGCALDLAADGRVGRSYPVGNVELGASALAATLTNPPTADEVRNVSDRHSLSAAVEGIVAAAHAMTTVSANSQ